MSGAQEDKEQKVCISRGTRRGRPPVDILSAVLFAHNQQRAPNGGETKRCPKAWVGRNYYEIVSDASDNHSPTLSCFSVR